MSKQKSPRVGSFFWLIQTPATRTYLIIGFAAMLIYYLLMSQRGGEIGALLIIVFAIPGLLGGWVVSPALFILLTTYLFIDPGFDGIVSFLGGDRSRTMGGFRGSSTRLFQIDDILLAVSGLAYLISHYRLQSLAFRGMPFEPRIQRKGELDDEDIPRPVSLVDDMEFAFVFLLSAVGMIVGQLGWWLLASNERSLGVANEILVERVVGRLLLFIFAMGVGTFLSTFVFSYLGWIKMSRQESQLILQDEVWQETRREEERIQHWRKWRRKKQGLVEGEVPK